MEPREVIAQSIMAAMLLADPPQPVNEATANALADLIVVQLGGAGYQIIKADHPV